MRIKVFSISMLSLLALSIGGVAFASVHNNNVEEVEAYSSSSLPSTIDLNPSTAVTIKDYYSELNGLADNQKTGTALLAHLKTILKNGQKYYSYDSGDAIWKLYEIADRDWNKSPASSISGYNSNSKIISGYSYRTSDPYVHALYNNRSVNNQATAWASHGERSNAWTIEREHVWPKSQGFEKTGQGGARGDPMHLMAAEGSANGDHSNHPYGYVDKTKSYKDTGNTHSNATGNLTGTSKTYGSGTVFEPQDSDKGDIARAIFYMVARYNNVAGNDNSIDTNNPNLELVNYPSELSSYTSSKTTTGKMGILSDLLEWNRLDPPDEYEIHRNDLLYTNFTNNRNPFIDYPDWAEYIWGDKANTNEGIVHPDTDSIHAFATDGGEPPADVPVTGVSLLASTTIKVGESIILTPEITPYNATNKSVIWGSLNTSVATVSNGKVTGVSAGVAEVYLNTVDGGYEAVCEVTVVEEESIDNPIDTITANDITLPSGSGYRNWSSVINGTSGATYNGASTVSSNAIQLNNNKETPRIGIISSHSTRNLRKISVEWNSQTAEGKTLIIYGKDSAYSAVSDLYSEATRGDALGSIVYGTSTELVLEDDYQYIGLYSSGASYYDSITFDWSIPVSSVSLDNDSVQLDLNGDTTATLTATVLPEDATNKNLSWSTSNGEVATISEGVITAVAEGNATITVTAEDGSKTDTCAVTVIDSTPEETDDVLIETSILSLATTYHWSNGVAFGTSEGTAISLDENISFYTTGTGNNGKYYTSGNNWRLYKNGDGNIIIKAEDGCTIKSVILNYTNTNEGHLVDGESNTVASGDSVDVNASSVEFLVAGSDKAQVRITNISVTYSVSGQAPAKALSSISITNYITLFSIGDSFNFGGTVTAHFDDESSQNVTGLASFSGYDMSSLGNQTVTVSYTYKEVTKTQTYQITIEEAVSSPYVNGVKYKLFFYNTTNANSYYFTGAMNGYYGATNTDYVEGVYVYFEQNGEGQNLYFLDNEEHKNYITIVQNDTHFNFTISTNTPSSPWRYSTTHKSIYFEINSAPYTIGTHSSYTTFSTFNLNNYPNNYKPQFRETAESFSYSVLNKITCDPTGNTSPIYHSGYSWSDLNAIYNTLDSTEQDLLIGATADQSGTLIEQAMAKYEYIVGKYSLENFISKRIPKHFPHNYLYIADEGNNGMLVVVILISLATLSISLAFIIKKRKK